jgi:WD40 repeat protein
MISQAALRKTENYKRHEDLVGGPRKKAKYEEDEDGDLDFVSDVPFSFGKRHHVDDDIIAMKRGEIDEEDDDSGDDFGPMPPPAAKQSEGEDFGPSPVSEPSTTSLFENYRKRMVQIGVKAEYEVSEAPKKKSESWYVYGKEPMPGGLDYESESAFEERLRQVKEATPSGDYDMDVLMDDENAKKLPIRYQAYLKGHTKPVLGLALDPKGVRLASAGGDFTLRLWDFTSMDKSLQSFRSLEPTENNVVHSIEWSKAGDKMLIAANTPQAQVLDREGRKQMETARGYQYTTDMTHTTGHISPITRATWIPSDPNGSFGTCGHDSTVRLWHVDEPKKHRTLIKLKNDRGMSVIKPQCLAFSETGANLVVASDDGSIQMFPTKGPFLRPSLRIGDAHTPASDTSDVAFVPGNDQHFASRGGDDSLKLWDIRRANSPLVSFPGLFNRFPQTSIAFKPDGSMMATGTSSSKNGDPGSVFFFDLKSLQLVKIIDVSHESVISLRWHKDTNQLLAGCGDGSISVLFDPDISSRGVMNCLSRALRKVSSQKTSEIDIITPFAPQTLNDRQRKAAERKDPHKSHKPVQPVSGRGSAGLLGSNLKADMMKKLRKDAPDVHIDPREALLRHASSTEPAQPANLDYEGLERINQAEKERAAALERAQRSKDRA